MKLIHASCHLDFVWAVIISRHLSMFYYSVIFIAFSSLPPLLSPSFFLLSFSPFLSPSGHFLALEKDSRDLCQRNSGFGGRLPRLPCDFPTSCVPFLISSLLFCLWPTSLCFLFIAKYLTLLMVIFLFLDPSLSISISSYRLKFAACSFFSFRLEIYDRFFSFGPPLFYFSFFFLHFYLFSFFSSSSSSSFVASSSSDYVVPPPPAPY